MVSLYKHHAPSTTSLSDDADDNDEEIQQFAFNPTHRLVPAEWAFKHEGNLTIQRPASHSPISTMPSELMIQIFKYLHSSRDVFTVMRVSRSWCQCSVELLWHKPSFPKYDTIHKMAAVLRKDSQTFTYSSFVRRLNFLNHGAEVTDELLSEFGRCDRLERLTLIGCKQISGETLVQVLPNFSHLVSIDLTGVTDTSSESIIGLATVATRLQGINLGGCQKITDSGIVALAKSCPLLRRVKLSGLTLVTDASVAALACGCPMLLEIDLNLCELISDVSVRLIWTKLSHMREMRLSHCSLLTDAAFPAPLGPDSQSDIVNPFANPDQLPPINQIFQSLRMLDLTSCALITDEAVEGIISHAPKIRNLVLSKCVNLTDNAVETICRLGKHLHYLHLGHASRITDRSVRLLARSCTRIRYIDFANCVLLTDMSVFELSALPRLRRVGLVRVNQLTDEAVYALAERHATLERIHLSYCDQISVMAIHFLLLKLHKLTHLSLTGVTAFRQSELQRFCREAPKEFNNTQRLAFCVFSGKGVSQLRTYLTELFDRITEMNHTDDTEYEEDDLDSQEDDTPEPETFNDVRDWQRIANGTHIPARREHNRTEQLHTRPNFLLQPDHAFMSRARRDGHATANPHIPISPTTNIRGATSRLNAQLGIVVPVNGPVRHQGAPSMITTHNSSLDQRIAQLEADQRSRRWDTVVSGLRFPTNHFPVADVLPIVESSGPPSPAELIPDDNGAGFFRTHQERRSSVPTISPRGNRALTPDLNYAEIGHGRGAQGSSSRAPGPAHDRTPRQSSLPRLSSASGPPQSASSDSENEVGDLAPEHSTPVPQSAENRWTQLGPGERSIVVETPPPPSTPVGTIQPILSTETRGRRDQQRQGTGNLDPRARSVKRTFRNTITAAEHYASSLLFGRATGDARPEAGGSATSSNPGTVHSTRPH